MQLARRQQDVYDVIKHNNGKKIPAAKFTTETGLAASQLYSIIHILINKKLIRREQEKLGGAYRYWIVK